MQTRFQVNDAFINAVGNFEELLGSPPSAAVAPLKSALASSAVLTGASGTVLGAVAEEPAVTA